MHVMQGSQNTFPLSQSASKNAKIFNFDVNVEGATTGALVFNLSTSQHLDFNLVLLENENRPLRAQVSKLSPNLYRNSAANPKSYQQCSHAPSPNAPCAWPPEPPTPAPSPPSAPSTPALSAAQQQPSSNAPHPSTHPASTHPPEAQPSPTSASKT